MLSGAERALLGILLIVLMLGMGSTLTTQSFRDVLKQPRGLLIGVLSQFGWMPLVAFLLSTSLELAAPAAIGLLIIGSTPGGTTSNMFTYYAKADVALSISMTVVSTLVAVVAMPLVLGLYASRIAGAQEFSIPYGSIITTLVLVLVPVAIGILIRAKREHWAEKVERAGSLSGIAVLLLLIVSGIVNNFELLTSLSAGIYLAAIGLGLLGIFSGYLSAWVARLNVSQRRAVALETGIQNSPLALGIIAASFGEESAFPEVEMMTPVVIYALFVLLTSSIATAVWRAMDRKAAA